MCGVPPSCRQTMPQNLKIISTFNSGKHDQPLTLMNTMLRCCWSVWAAEKTDFQQTFTSATSSRWPAWCVKDARSLVNDWRRFDSCSWLNKKHTQHKQSPPRSGEPIKAGCAWAIHDLEETLGNLRPGEQLAAPRWHERVYAEYCLPLWLIYLSCLLFFRVFYRRGQFRPDWA